MRVCYDFALPLARFVAMPLWKTSCRTFHLTKGSKTRAVSGTVYGHAHSNYYAVQMADEMPAV